MANCQETDSVKRCLLCGQMEHAGDCDTRRRVDCSGGCGKFQVLEWSVQRWTCKQCATCPTCGLPKGGDVCEKCKAVTDAMKDAAAKEKAAARRDAGHRRCVYCQQFVDTTHAINCKYTGTVLIPQTEGPAPADGTAHAHWSDCWTEAEQEQWRRADARRVAKERQGVTGEQAAALGEPDIGRIEHATRTGRVPSGKPKPFACCHTALVSTVALRCTSCSVLLCAQHSVKLHGDDPVRVQCIPCYTNGGQPIAHITNLNVPGGTPKPEWTKELVLKLGLSDVEFTLNPPTGDAQAAAAHVKEMMQHQCEACSQRQAVVQCDRCMMIVCERCAKVSDTLPLKAVCNTCASNTTPDTLNEVMDSEAVKILMTAARVEAGKFVCGGETTTVRDWLSDVAYYADRARTEKPSELFYTIPGLIGKLAAIYWRLHTARARVGRKNNGTKNN